MAVCRNCGTEQENGAAFCGNCGSKIEFVAPVQVTPAPVPAGKKNNSILITCIVSLAAVIIVAMLLFTNMFGGKILSEPGQDSEPIPTPGPVPEIVPEIVIEEDPIDMAVIDSIIASDAKGARISACIIDLGTGKVYATDNAYNRMSASALVNIPILYTASKCISSGYDNWNSEVTFWYRYAGRGSIQAKQSGNSFSLDYLVRQMLRYSDNNASNSLMDYYSRGYIGDICAQFGYNSVELQRYVGESSNSRDNYISAVDAASMLAEMYSGKAGHGVTNQYLTNNFSIEDANKRKGIGKNLPGGVTFLNHNGVTNSIYNEAGIVASPEAEYVMVVLCNGGTMDSSANTVAEISSYVYGALSE